MATATGGGRALSVIRPAWTLPAGLSVRWRLVGLVVLVVAGMLVAAAYWFRLEALAQATAAAQQDRARTAVQMQDLRTHFGEYRYWVLALLADARPGRPAAEAQTRVRIEHAAARLSGSLEAVSAGADIGRIRAELELIAGMLPEAVAALEHRSAAAEQLPAELRARLDALYDDLARPGADSTAAGSGARSGPDRAEIAVLLGIVVLTLLFSAVLIHSIVRPLQALVQASDALLANKDEAALPQQRTDEIGAIARALQHFNERARHSAFLACHDPLSGLPNRSQLHEVVNAQMARHRGSGQAMVMLYVGLPQLTMINETFGPSAGDEYVRIAARRLRACAPDNGLPFHMGGSHFVVLVTGMGNDSHLIAHADRLARNLVSDMSRPFPLQDQEVEMAANVGVATWPQDGEAYEELLSNAHAALTQARRRGRNHFQFYTRQITDKARSRLALASQLRHAVEAGEFTVHYQPVLDVLAQRPVAAEALMRWRHPQRGLVMPADFIEVAEETGVIHAMGDWCLAQACLDSRNWQQAGLGPLKLAVNLSARQLNEPGLVDTVEQTLQYTGLAPRDLEFEITESAVMHNPDRAVRVLRHLKSLGITLTVDDFGTGYSSLAYLQRFPLDKIKIDRSFVARLNRRRKDELIIAATTGLAADLGLDVVAEGVETTEQMEVLQQLGCRYMQGFLFARSLPPDDFLNWARAPEQWSSPSQAVN